MAEECVCMCCRKAYINTDEKFSYLICHECAWEVREDEDE